MKEYVCVTSRCFQDGTVTVKINVSRRSVKPKNKFVHGTECDMHIDWYESMKKALIAAAECQRLSKK